MSSMDQSCKARGRAFVTVTVVTATLVHITLYVYLNRRAFAEKRTEFTRHYRNITFTKTASCRPWSEQVNHMELGFRKSEEFDKYPIPLYERRNWNLADTPPRPRGCPRCTKEIFREEFRKTRQFPFNGTWLRHIDSNSSELFNFHPNFCSFSDKELSKEYIRNCLVRKNINKIFSIGDSNTVFLLEGLYRIFEKALDNCYLESKRNISLDTDLKYWLRNISFKPSDINFSAHHCRSCSKRFVCSYTTKSSKDSTEKAETRIFKMEQVSNLRVIDNTRQIKVKFGPFRPTNISQEFLLRDYLRIDGYPDVIIFQTPFTHEIFEGMLQSPGSTRKLWKPLKQLRHLIKKYIPSTTSLYYMTCHDIVEEGFPPPIKNQLLRESIDIFTKEAESDIVSLSNNVWPFYNLYPLSGPVKTLHKPADRVHMKPGWYHVFAKHFLEMHCNS